MKSAFEVDMLDEEEKKDVTCSQCGAIFAFKFNLKRHVSLYSVDHHYCIVPMELFYIERGCNSRTEI